MASIIDRFEAKFDKGSDCWEWTAGKNRYGYGKFKIAGQWQRAHRISYQLYVGAIPDGLCVCHHCDNRKCVNPAHLFLGTRADNAHDRDDKGRGPAGESHGRAKLTAEQIIEIKARWAKGDRQHVIAKEFSVAQSAISLIVNRHRWARYAT